MRMRTKRWARPELSVCPFLSRIRKNCGQWASQFPKQQPVYLELGCGKCPFLSEMGRLHPDVNFIGIDLSLDILGVARRKIVAVLRSRNLRLRTFCCWPTILNISTGFSVTVIRSIGFM